MRASKRNRFISLLGLVAISACEMPTEPLPAPLSEDGPNMLISDAAHGGATGFYFLPPMIKKPKPFSGKFDATLSPVVRICRWVDEACAGSDIVIDGNGKGAQRLKRKGASYGALWKDTGALDVGDVYRLRVYKDAADTRPLGFADLLIVAKNRDEKRVPAEYIGVARRPPFHIKFRIEEGATPGSEDDEAPAVTATTPADGASGEPRNVNLSITFSEAVNVTGDWFSIVCDASGERGPAATTISGGPTTFTIDPTTNFVAGESCTVTVDAAGVSDQDANDPPDNLTANHVFTFTVAPMFAPEPVDDGPAPNSVPGDPYHAFVGLPIQLLPPGLLANDARGVPTGAISSFGGGSLGGSVTTHAAGSIVPFGDGELFVTASGGVAFRPPTGFTGPFTFQYRVTNSVGSGDATVTIFVGPRPPTM